MEKRTFMTVDEVAKELNVSKSYAYKVVRELNEADGLPDSYGKSKYELLPEKVMLQGGIVYLGSMQTPTTTDDECLETCQGGSLIDHRDKRSARMRRNSDRKMSAS